MASKPKNRGGTDTLKARGLVQLVVTLTEEERRMIHRAAGLDDLPATHWLRRLAVEAATKRLGKPVN